MNYQEIEKLSKNPTTSTDILDNLLDNLPIDETILENIISNFNVNLETIKKIFQIVREGSFYGAEYDDFLTKIVKLLINNPCLQLLELENPNWLEIIFHSYVDADVLYDIYVADREFMEQRYLRLSDKFRYIVINYTYNLDTVLFLFETENHAMKNVVTKHPLFPKDLLFEYVRKNYNNIDYNESLIAFNSYITKEMLQWILTQPCDIQIYKYVVKSRAADAEICLDVHRKVSKIKLTNDILGELIPFYEKLAEKNLPFLDKLKLFLSSNAVCRMVLLLDTSKKENILLILRLLSVPFILIDTIVLHFKLNGVRGTFIELKEIWQERTQKQSGK